MIAMEKTHGFIGPARQSGMADPTWSDRRSNRVGSTLASAGGTKADITRLESELATVRAKMQAYLEELGV